MRGSSRRDDWSAPSCGSAGRASPRARVTPLRLGPALERRNPAISGPVLVAVEGLRRLYVDAPGDEDPGDDEERQTVGRGFHEGQEDWSVAHEARREQLAGAVERQELGDRRRRF